MACDRHLLCITLATFVLGLAVSRSGGQEKIERFFLPPDLLIQHKQQLDLTASQLNAIKTQLEQAGSDFRMHAQNSEAASRKMAQLLKADVVNEEAVLNQLDAILAIEKSEKQLRLQVMIRLRNQLTAEQRKKAFTLKTSYDAQSTKQRLSDQLTQIGSTLTNLSRAGRHFPKLQAKLQQVSNLIQSDRLGEAKSLLEVIKLKLQPILMAVEHKKSTKNGPAPQSVFSPANEPSDRPGTKIEKASPASVDRRIAQMKQNDVAWRKIPWKSCLLDGLKESRLQNKPVILWVFIDRPIDDERC
ncbi:MAG: periplasmic heavy metal sensor [Pirellulaceae bacterium]|nr:periplasmic heavy metal sensor [Pirellulaceae bacterium]